MTSISKVFLCAAVSAFCLTGRFSYASTNTVKGIPKPGTHTVYTQQLNLADKTRLSLLFNYMPFDITMANVDESYQLASVCFITDTGACSGEKFGNSEDPGKGGNPATPTPGEFCEKAGYVNTPCPEGMTPGNFCPADSSYHSGCKCAAEYNQTCDSAAGLKPVNANDTCGGKYKECCNTCTDYTYTSIPSGYVKDGECLSCDGKKYKVKCDTTLYPVASGVCGSYGGSGGTCSDDTGAHYKKCNCPNNYEWNAGPKKCVCATSFKYSCNGSGYAGGDGNSCDGKYSKCKCAAGYTWDATSGSCVCSGTDWCSVNQNCAALGYAKQTCSGTTVKCPFDTSYVFCLDNGSSGSSSGGNTGNNSGKCTIKRRTVYANCRENIHNNGQASNPWKVDLVCSQCGYTCEVKSDGSCTQLYGTMSCNSALPIGESASSATKEGAQSIAERLKQQYENKIISETCDN
ncbi:MAG: hypothetical protein Q4F75_09305 [Pseudomonadota bacterium]|nr:hypothetical protein [Pseudomonadota bacterium]